MHPAPHPHPRRQPRHRPARRPRPAALAVALALGLAACDGGPAPILDGPPSAAYRDDLAACRALARAQRQFEVETAGAALLGAGAGALLGAADPEGGAAGGALAGALAGGLAGTADAADRRHDILRACLRGRGHPVVG